MPLEILRADYSNPQHAADLVSLLNAYAEDPMGGGAPLSASVKENLAASLANIPHAFSILAYIDSLPAGLVNCFEGFSTFHCKPLINVHDVVVVQQFRGQGLSLQMLEVVENIARKRGCCKLTLEVLEGNPVAQNAYRKFGFDGFELDPEHGRALFWQKFLD